MLYVSRVCLQHASCKGDGNMVANFQVLRRNIRVSPQYFCLFPNRETKLASEIDVVYLHTGYPKGIALNVGNLGVEGLRVEGRMLSAGRLTADEIKHTRNSRAVTEKCSYKTNGFFLMEIPPFYMSCNDRRKNFIKVPLSTLGLYFSGKSNTIENEAL